MVSGLSAAELEAGGEGATPSAALRPVLRGIGLFVAGFTDRLRRPRRHRLGHRARPHDHRGHAHLHQRRHHRLPRRGHAARARCPLRVWANAGLGHARPGARGSPASTASTSAPRDSGSGRRPSWAWPSPSPGRRVSAQCSASSSAWPAAPGPSPAASCCSSRTRSGSRCRSSSSGLAFGRFTAAMGKARHWLWAVELVAGALLIGFGVILLTDNIGCDFQPRVELAQRHRARPTDDELTRRRC